MSSLDRPGGLEVFAPAKINLGLSVLGLLPGGYHALRTVMVPLSVGDTLELRPAPGLSLRVLGADLPGDGRNLVFRAARAYLDAAGVAGGADITLYKRLPLASGLGGGSSDAAHTLRGLERLFGAGLDLGALAAGLGADVPFFLGDGPALAEGRGERLTPLELPELHLVLLNPGVAVSAADAYRWLDEGGSDALPLDPSALLGALRAGEPFPLHNDLQGGVAARHPQIGEALAALAGAGLPSALMSGSGSTCFALARDEAQARQAARRLAEAHPGWWVRAAHSLTGAAHTDSVHFRTTSEGTR
ncbi:MAG: 4-(cytidine 5'-diphospho)-2-C-methyl-D-erythritol kinase [Deinococcus sp.]